MLAVATLDPSTLCLWLNPTPLTDATNVEQCFASLDLSRRADLSEYQSYYSGLPSKAQDFSAGIASAVWHEKRHFLDLILTNYGAYRVRQFFMVAVNSMAILKTLDKRIAFPLWVYTSSMRRTLAGLPEPPQPIATMCREILYRQALFSNENRPITIQNFKCEIGGDAQLEALGYIFQLGSLQYWLGPDAAVRWQKSLGDDQHANTRYRWAELIADAYDLLPTHTAPVEFVDLTLLVSVLYASLMMRAWGQSYTHDRAGAINILPPFARIRMLLDELKGFRYGIASLSVGEAWELVNSRCKKLWGKTATEELEADYLHEEKWVAKLDTAEHGARAFRDFHEVRGTLIDAFKQSPEMFLDLNRWSESVLPKLQPNIIMANPGGVDGTPPDGMEPVLKDDAPEQSAHWWWAAMLGKDDSPYCFRSKDAWLFVIQYLGPLAKLMLCGRRHELMIGPELLLMERELKRLKFTIYFEPAFEYPSEQDDTEDFYRLTTRSQFTCDFCRVEIQRGQGKLIGPWTIRRNIKLAHACASGLGEGDLGWIRLWKDWSHWHFCDRCLDLVKEKQLLEFGL